jgi:hypothetical protein
MTWKGRWSELVLLADMNFTFVLRLLRVNADVLHKRLLKQSTSYAAPCGKPGKRAGVPKIGTSSQVMEREHRRGRTDWRWLHSLDQ